MATSAVFAELKQFKAICPGNRHTHYSNPRYAPTYSEVKTLITIKHVSYLQDNLATFQHKYGFSLHKLMEYIETILSYNAQKGILKGDK